MVGTESRINKTYQLSREDDPALIPVEDFLRGELTYSLLDMTRTDTVGVDTLNHTEGVTQPSKTKNEEEVRSQLAPTLDVTTQEGYMGTLLLEEDSVTITADGYATGSRNHSAVRTYPNLSDSDTSLIPKTVEEDGRTLNLSDIQWTESLHADGIGGTVTRYTASATYTGSSTYQYATGYTVAADYSGEVAKSDTSVVVYTAIFGGGETVVEPEVSDETQDETVLDTTKTDIDIKLPLLIGGGLLAAGGGLFLFTKYRKRG